MDGKILILVEPNPPDPYTIRIFDPSEIGKAEKAFLELNAPDETPEAMLFEVDLETKRVKDVSPWERVGSQPK